MQYKIDRRSQAWATNIFILATVQIGRSPTEFEIELQYRRLLFKHIIKVETKKSPKHGLRLF
ncbi:hypothetical protein D7V31_09425 [Acinetobacter sp. WCHAc060007]|nr:hypothetical protein D7V31_09425 [Acinetobacter sp. WCHAc060007]